MSIPSTRTIEVPGAPLVAAILTVLALGGCATFSKDGGFGSVAQETRTHLGKEVRWARTEQEQAKSDGQVAELLRQPLSAEDAVQIALLNNRSLQASFDRARRFRGRSRAVGPPAQPPIHPASRRRGGPVRHRGDPELQCPVDAHRTLCSRDREAPLRASAERRSHRAWCNWPTTRGRPILRRSRPANRCVTQEQVKTAADAGAELARRMVAAGNWNLLDQAREQSFYTDAAQRLTRARLADAFAREKLLRLMGLPAEQPGFQLGERLPELPQRIEDLPDVERVVLQNRIDLRLQRMQLDELARNLRLTRATRFINVLDVGPTRVLQGADGAPYERGYEVILEIPLFDGGGPRVRRAEALYSQAAERFTQAAVDARSQIRRDYAAYRAAFDIAKRQRDEVVPNAKAVAAENLLRYNASLLSVFDLLADARRQIESVSDSIQSVRDFWMAKSELDTALLGNPAP